MEPDLESGPCLYSVRLKAARWDLVKNCHSDHNTVERVPFLVGQSHIENIGYGTLCLLNML